MRELPGTDPDGSVVVPAELRDVDLLMVDVMNVVGSRPDGWWRDRPAAVRRLVAQLRGVAGSIEAAVVAVVDGRPSPELPEGAHGLVMVRYAPGGGPDAADDRIVELLTARREQDASERVVVVTADRGLRARIAVLGASALGPRQLLDAMAARSPDCG